MARELMTANEFRGKMNEWVLYLTERWCDQRNARQLAGTTLPAIKAKVREDILKTLSDKYDTL